MLKIIIITRTGLLAIYEILNGRFFLFKILIKKQEELRVNSNTQDKKVSKSDIEEFNLLDSSGPTLEDLTSGTRGKVVVYLGWNFSSRDDVENSAFGDFVRDLED